jgi:hypothetical protein
MDYYTLKYRGPIDFKPERQPNGKWAIRGVPIFECHTREDIGKVDATWMYAACAEQKRLKADGFLPRLIVGHTSEEPGANEKGIVGYLDNYRFNESDQWLYADYVEIEEEDLPLLKRLPGRSAEAGIRRPSINTVALLGGTPPYFKLPDVRFASREPVALYSVEIPQMVTEPKAQESNASGSVSPEEKADYAKFCRYMKAYEAEKATAAPVKTPAEADGTKPFGATGSPKHDAKMSGTREWDEEEGEPPPPSYPHADPELKAKYSDLVETSRAQAAKILALEEAGEKSAWLAKYHDARIPAGRMDIGSKVDLLMKMPHDVRQAFYDDSLRGLTAPSTKPLPKDEAAGTPIEPGSQEEADAVKAKYYEWRGKGIVKNYGEAQAKYLKECR